MISLNAFTRLGSLTKALLTLSLREQTILNLRQFHGSRTLLIIVRHMVDTATHRMAAHQASIAGFQEFRNRCDVLHTGVEPQVVAGGVENNWHSVVDG